MLRRVFLAGVVGLVPALAGAAELVEATGPQGELPKQKLVIVTQGGVRHEFQVEIARTPQQQMTGEMFRPTVPADGGMLFVWDRVQESDMWMHNTVAPLDMLFIGVDGTVSHVAEDAVPESLAIISSGGPVRATLEVAAGTVRRLGIRVGDRVLNASLGTGP